MADVWVRVLTRHMETGHSINLGQTTPDEAWRHPGDVISFFWRTPEYFDHCPWNAGERTFGYFVLLTNLPDTVEHLGVTYDNIPATIMSRISTPHIETTGPDVSRFIHNRRGMSGVDYRDERKVYQRIRSKIPQNWDDSLGGNARAHLAAYWNYGTDPDVEQPNNSFLTVDWQYISGWYYDKILDLDLDQATLLGVDELVE